MKQNRKFVFVATALALILAAAGAARLDADNGLSMPWWSAYGGGGRSSSAGGIYAITDNVGQPAVGAALGGNGCRMENGFLAAWADAVLPAGAPILTGAQDIAGGIARLGWANYALKPLMFLGLAYDVYAGDWVYKGWQNSVWWPFYPPAAVGDLNLGNTGAYFAWISNYYVNQAWAPCLNPAAFIMYSGLPHEPMDVQAEAVGGKVRLHWKPDIFGTWHWQIIVLKVGAGWIETQGPGGLHVWHFVDYGGAAYAAGEADFFQGWADFTLPPGQYWLFVRGASWASPYPVGEFGQASITVEP